MPTGLNDHLLTGGRMPKQSSSFSSPKGMATKETDPDELDLDDLDETG